MIISRTPLRVSFAGGGTDLSAYYQGRQGAVLSTAINKYIYITTNQKFDHKVRVSYSVTELVDKASELQHELIRESLALTGIEGGIEITSISDIPSSGTGLGSSSTYTVGLLNALHAYEGRPANAERLASEACQIEIDILKKPIGKQDQYAAAYGGFQLIRFNADGTVFVDPVIVSQGTKQRLQENLLMMFTGLTRSADTILLEQSKNTNERAANKAALDRMRDCALELLEGLQNNDLSSFGSILDETWKLKQSLANGVSNPTIDDWYARAREAGAEGGKILGAGGGGFLLLYANQSKHADIVNALPEMTAMPFAFEPQGSKIIFIE